VSGKWKIVNYTEKKASPDTYFRATTFKNGKNIVISYCGTNDPIGEWVWNIVGVGVYNYHAEEGYARAYALAIAKKYKDCNIYITGHSLGGYLAQIGTAQILKTKPDTKLMKVAYFNGIGLKFNKFRFWDKNEELDLLSNYYNDKEDKSSNLISYFINGDIVSGIGMHSGAKIDHFATESAREHHFLEFGTSSRAIVVAACLFFDSITNANMMKYYKYYETQSIMEYFWVTHETDSFFLYLEQGNRKIL
jgi:hypothetical protein